MDEHTFTVSAATHFGIDERLKKVVEMLEKTDVQEVYHVENIPHQEVKHIANSMRNIGDHEKEVLIEENYISAKDAQYINVREVYNEEFAKLVRQLQR